MSFKDLVHYLRVRYAAEEGQTMAEYGVVLAVIAIGVILALTAESPAQSTPSSATCNPQS